MKRILLFITVIVLPALISAKEIEAEVTEAYQAKKYDKAIELLETELAEQKKQGYESSELYYNLGNAYFRSNEVPKALLYYEKSLLLDPGNRDTRHNIEYARTKIEDKIVPIDNFFLQSWFTAIQNCFSSNTWAVISIILFLIAIGSLFAFFFVKIITVKKAAFYVIIVALPVLICTNIFSSNQKAKLINHNTAIIMAGSVSVVNSPDINGQELFVIHAGTKVKINKEDGEWVEIEIENGHVGWVQQNKFERI